MMMMREEVVYPGENTHIFTSLCLILCPVESCLSCEGVEEEEQEQEYDVSLVLVVDRSCLGK